jgi:hypothetical protein
MQYLECGKCGWIQFSTGDSVTLIMIDDHKFDDLCDGEIRIEKQAS